MTHVEKAPMSAVNKVERWGRILGIISGLILFGIASRGRVSTNEKLWLWIIAFGTICIDYWLLTKSPEA